MIVRTYKQKPVEVTATQWDGTLESGDDIYLWAGNKVLSYTTSDGKSALVVYTSLGGDVRLNPGDWILCNDEGEFFPCADDVFKAKYERI